MTPANSKSIPVNDHIMVIRIAGARYCIIGLFINYHKCMDVNGVTAVENKKTNIKDRRYNIVEFKMKTYMTNKYEKNI